MADVKYVCSECGHESDIYGPCPNCRTLLVASCAVCGNPVVGEHVHAGE